MALVVPRGLLHRRRLLVVVLSHGWHHVAHWRWVEGRRAAWVEYTARRLKRICAWGEAWCVCARLELGHFSAHRGRCIGLLLRASIWKEMNEFRRKIEEVQI